MNEVTTITLTGDQMLQMRTSALDSAIKQAGVSGEPATAKILYDASTYLNFLINGMPIDSAPGYISAAKPNTPEVLAGAGGVAPAQEAAPTKRKPKLASVPTSASANSAPSTAPVQAANPVQTDSAVSGSATTGSSAATSLIPAPTTLQEAANSLKALVQNDARGKAAGFVSGREAAIALLTKYGVAQLSQVPAPKLAEVKAALDALGTQAAAPAAAGSDLI